MGGRGGGAAPRQRRRRRAGVAAPAVGPRARGGRALRGVKRYVVLSHETTCTYLRPPRSTVTTLNTLKLSYREMLRGPGRNHGATLYTRKHLSLSRGPGRKPGAFLYARRVCLSGTTLPLAILSTLITSKTLKLSYRELLKNTPWWCDTLRGGRQQQHPDRRQRHQPAPADRCGNQEGNRDGGDLNLAAAQLQLQAEASTRPLLSST